MKATSDEGAVIEVGREEEKEGTEGEKPSIEETVTELEESEAASSKQTEQKVDDQINNMFSKVQAGKEVDKNFHPAPTHESEENDYSMGRTVPLQNEEALSLNIENSQNPVN